jgi:hypothetical protein
MVEANRAAEQTPTLFKRTEPDDIQSLPLAAMRERCSTGA